MSNYQTFKTQFLIACYQYNEETGNDMVRVGDVIDRYGLQPNASWTRRAIEGLIEQGYSKDVRSLGSDLDQRIWLTSAGYEAAEEEISTHGRLSPVTPQPTAGTAISTASGTTFIGAGSPPPELGRDGDVFLQIQTESVETRGSIALRTFDSAAWTGLSERVKASPEIIEEVAERVREIDLLIEGSELGNEAKSSAKAITQALVALLNDPEPEWKIIVELLNSKKLTAFLNSVQIITLIFTLLPFGI